MQARRKGWLLESLSAQAVVTTPQHVVATTECVHTLALTYSAPLAML